MDAQQIMVDPIAWYYIAPGVLLLGVIMGNSLTQGLKVWRTEHVKESWPPSDTRLLGRVLSALSTSVAWIAFTLLSGQDARAVAIGIVLALIGFGIAPKLWDLFEWSLPYLKKYILRKLDLGKDDVK